MYREVAMTTRSKERSLVTQQDQMNKKKMKIMSILSYGCLHAIDNLPLYTNCILTDIDIYPNCLVWKWESI